MIFYRQQIRQLRYIGRDPCVLRAPAIQRSGRAVAQSMAVAKFSSKALFALLAENESGTL
jgi:hypothetical protein